MNRKALQPLATLYVALLTATPALSDNLQDPVRRTLAEKFPGLEIVGSGTESERRVTYYEVHLIRGERKVEVEIAADGNIGETEVIIAIDDLPSDQPKIIREAVGPGDIRRIEKHVRFGVARNGTFEPVDTPGGFYKVSYRDRGYNRYVCVPVSPDQLWAVEEDDP